MVCLWFYHQYHSTNVLQNSSFRFLQHDLRNFLKQKEALLNLEREAKETEDQQITWQKNEQSYDRDWWRWWFWIAEQFLQGYRSVPLGMFTVVDGIHDSETLLWVAKLRHWMFRRDFHRDFRTCDRLNPLRLANPRAFTSMFKLLVKLVIGRWLGTWNSVKLTEVSNFCLFDWVSYS